ncbi:transcriptional repressor [Albimonas sp. CAU 1670]|uniref:transcriptional repressor n=1 Tax=Albimonas sp. CAU 1670 TaxID=3032599 RepID=UPI0023D997DB|nr:transcriptional repressor [Albimonas sp. CAU 1670]MDF2231967.1 transcriptional repressor [Albimonas sp. CAU 1670]
MSDQTPSAPAAPREPAPAAFRRHDHRRCVADARAAVEAACAERGLRLTPARARVLEILLASHEALGAYDVLERLREGGHPAQPPVAYRALDFLVANGFAHRIEKLNAFVACAHPGDAGPAAHAPAFMICRGCRRVAETSAAPAAASVADAARDLGFEVERTVVEVEGVCPDCRHREGEA